MNAFVREKLQNCFPQGNVLGSHIFRFFPILPAISSNWGALMMPTYLDSAASPARIMCRQHAHASDASLPQVGQPLAVKVQYQDADWAAASSRATYFSAIGAHRTPPIQRFGKQVAAYLGVATHLFTQAAMRLRLLNVAIIECRRIHWQNIICFCARAPVAEPYAPSRLTGTRARTCLKRKGFQHIASQVCVCGGYV